MLSPVGEQPRYVRQHRINLSRKFLDQSQTLQHLLRIRVNIIWLSSADLDE